MKKALDDLADQVSFCLVTVHREGGCEVLRGNPEAVLGIPIAEFAAEGLAQRIVGTPPSPAAWDQELQSSVYLLRSGKRVSQWVESRSLRIDEKSVLVSTRKVGPAETVQELSRLARLCLGGSLLGSMVHELNNLAQGFSAAEFLFRDCCENGELLDPEDVDHLGEAVHGLLLLGRELQRFTRMSYTPAESLDILEVVTDATKFMRHVGILKTVKLSIESPDELPSLRWRRFEIDFIVMALLCNAADAARETAIQTVSVSLALRVNSVDIVFSNSGGSLDLQAAIAPFVSTKRPERHIGLGLSTVAALLHSQGASLHTENGAGEGASVRISLPLA